MTGNTSQLLTLAGLAIAVVAIVTAWGFELFGGIEPCPLCLEQRVAYYVAIPLAVVALILLPGAVGRLFVFGAAAAMVWTMALGVYHAGAEWALWEGPDTCGAGASGTVTDAASLMAAVEEARFVSCLQDTGRVLGLSFAGWNVVASGSAMLLFLTATFALKGRGGIVDAA